MRFSISMLCGPAVPLGLVLAACGGDGPTNPPEPEARAPAAIAIVSGQDQQGKAGEPLPEPFVVRVTDDRGDGVEGVEVTWRVTTGAGHFGPDLYPTEESSTVSVDTDPDGTARVFFRPAILGTSTVAADVSGLSPVRFTTDVAVVVILFGPIFDCTPGDPNHFLGPDGTSDVAVPVGTPVEWVYAPYLVPSTCEARVTSSSEPPGGEPIDSGILTPGERFRFVPAVAGTWEYRDGTNEGADGTLTAR